MPVIARAEHSQQHTGPPAHAARPASLKPLPSSGCSLRLKRPGHTCSSDSGVPRLMGICSHIPTTPLRFSSCTRHHAAPKHTSDAGQNTRLYPSLHSSLPKLPVLKPKATLHIGVLQDEATATQSSWCPCHKTVGIVGGKGRCELC